MAQYEVAWTFPKYSGYSIFNAGIHPAICWNGVQNNPFISAFEVDFLDLQELEEKLKLNFSIVLKTDGVDTASYEVFWKYISGNGSER